MGLNHKNCVCDLKKCKHNTNKVIKYFKGFTFNQEIIFENK